MFVEIKKKDTEYSNEKNSTTRLFEHHNMSISSVSIFFSHSTHTHSIIPSTQNCIYNKIVYKYITIENLPTEKKKYEQLYRQKDPENKNCSIK